MCNPADTLFERYGAALIQNGEDAKGHPVHIRKRRCGRCGGAGRSNAWAHTGYTCYDCGGAGTRGDETLRLYTQDELDRLNAIQAKARATKAAKVAKAFAAKQAADAVLAEQRAEALAADPFITELRAFAGRSEFLGDLAVKAAIRDLSEKQVEAAKSTIAKIKERDVQNETSDWLGAEGERVEIDGIVRTSKVVSYGTPYAGFGMDRDKLLIKLWTAKGWVVIFTPKNYQVGERLIGKATVKKLGEFRGVKETTVQRFTGERVLPAVVEA